VALSSPSWPQKKLSTVSETTLLYSDIPIRTLGNKNPISFPQSFFIIKGKLKFGCYVLSTFKHIGTLNLMLRMLDNSVSFKKLLVRMFEKKLSLVLTIHRLTPCSEIS
jgi:hypothetical protein